MTTSNELPQQLKRYNDQAVLVGSHPRSGTHLVIDLLRRQFSSCRNWRWWGLPLDHLYLNIERLIETRRRFSDSVALKIISRAKHPILKTHALPDFSAWCFESQTADLPTYWLEWIDQARGKIYVVRNPRKVMASYQQFSLSFEPRARCQISDFIRQKHRDTGLTRVGWWAHHVRSWVDTPGVIVLKFEDIINRPEEAVDTLSATLRLEPTHVVPTLPTNENSILRSRINRLLQLSPDSTAIIASAPSAQHLQLYGDGDQEYFLAEAGDVMNRFGYK